MMQNLNWDDGMCRKRIVKVRIFVFVVMLLTLTFNQVMAAEPGAIVSAEPEDSNIVLYVQNPGNVEQIDAQIGTTACEQVSFQEISDMDLPVETYILLDNSLSIPENYRPQVNEIISGLAANRMDGETITIAAFSDSIQYLIQDSKDFSLIKQTLDNLTYEYQDTYLTDILFPFLEELDAKETSVFRRIIIISDGMDNNSIGYTRDELTAKLKTQPYPIYTIGCQAQDRDNSEELKNMFALSRQTQAESWLLDETADSMTMITGVAASNDMLRVVVTPPPEVCDGTEKGVQLAIHSSAGTLNPKLVMRMPFAEMGTAPPATQVPAEVTSGDAKQGFLPPMWMIAAGLAFIGVVFIVLILILVLRKKGRRQPPQQPPVNVPPVIHTPPPNQAGQTEIVSSGDQTAMVWRGDQKSYTLIITDKTNLARSFEVPLNNKVVIGRSRNDCQIVIDYDKSVSGCHCEIFASDGKFYVKDLNSSNGTVLNNKRVVGQTEIYSGSLLELGRVKFGVEIV